jgi:hypothetical protein
MTISRLRKNRLARLNEFRDARLKHVISSAQSALRSAFLVNGGAAVALLAFFGHATDQCRAASVTRLLADALLVLVVGTALAGLATGLSFLAQFGYFIRRSRSWFGKAAPTITVVNIWLIAGSYACFGVKHMSITLYGRISAELGGRMLYGAETA